MAEHLLTDEQLIELMIADHEAGIADVLQAYESAAVAYTTVVGASWPTEVFVVGSTAPAVK